jgi:nicotinamidase-related amidase
VERWFTPSSARPCHGANLEGQPNWRKLLRDTIIIGGGATNRGVETSVREAFNFDLASVVVRECE